MLEETVTTTSKPVTGTHWLVLLALCPYYKTVIAIWRLLVMMLPSVLGILQVQGAAAQVQGRAAALRQVAPILKGLRSLAARCHVARTKQRQVLFVRGGSAPNISANTFVQTHIIASGRITDMFSASARVTEDILGAARVPVYRSQELTQLHHHERLFFCSCNTSLRRSERGDFSDVAFACRHSRA